MTTVPAAPISWSMPQPVLKLVAILIGAACLGAFALGVATAPDRSRLPGERRGQVVAGEAMEATDATPLVDERIQGTPPPRELTEEEKAKLEADKKAKEEAAAAAKAAADLLTADPAAPPVPAAPAAPAEKAPPPPPPEEPVF